MSFLFLFKPSWVIPKTSNQVNVFKCVGLFLLTLILSFLLNYSFQNTSANNLLWTIITYGSSLTALIVFISLPYKRDDIRSILKFSIALTLFEIALGYYQMVAWTSFTTFNPFSLSAGAGDEFVGTTFDVGVGNQIAVKISVIALLFFPFWFSKKDFRNTTLLFLLVFGWLLPSAIYTLLAGLLVIFLYYFLSKILLAVRTLRLNLSIFFSAAIGVLLVIAFMTLQPGNISYVTVLLTRAYNTVLGNNTDSKLGKVLYYKETLTSMIREYPHAFIIGLGPGNYSSRSAWLVSGAYLENQPTYIPITPSQAAKKYTLNIWTKDSITEAFPDASSISYQPFSTWLSVFSEFGILGFLAFAGIFYFLSRIIVSVLKNTQDVHTRKVAMGTRIVFTYIVVIFFVDNLFEWPIVMGQMFIFIGLLTRWTDPEGSV